MGHALRIFRKDVRHLWPRIAIVLAAYFLAAWATYGPAPLLGTARNIAGMPIQLAWLYLIAAVIHEEALPGNRQYWLTRPFSRRDLLAAKAIFILIVVCLPCFCTEVTILVLRGKSPLAYLPEVLVSQLFGLAKVFLPAAALAAITVGLVEFAWTTLAALAGFYLILMALASRFLSPAELDWGGLDWFRATVTAALLLAASVAILLVQYVRRQTWLSRGILAAALPIGVFLAWMPGWHTAFVLQCRLTGQPVADSVARIVFDPTRDRRTRPTAQVLWRPGQGTHGISIPVRVTGIPEGMALYSERATVTLDAPARARWSSGWNSLNSLCSPHGRALPLIEEERLLPSGGEYWLYVNLDRSFYNRIGSGPTHLHARMALTLLSREQTSLLTPRWGEQAVSSDGFCWITSLGRQPWIACSWPVRTPARFGFRLRSRETNLPPTRGGTSVGSYGPYPTSGGLWQWSDQADILRLPLDGIDLFTRGAVAHFERDLDIPALGEWIDQ